MALLGEPPRTQFDFGFSVFGFRVRVCAFFWLAAILLGQGAASLGAKFLLLWIAAMFLSILIHELGHAFAFRHFGISSHIVLYHFGGLAIPDSMGSPWNVNTRARDPRSDLLISAAGPAAQILGAMALIVIFNAGGFSVPVFGFVQNILPAQNGRPLPSEELHLFLAFFINVSIFWALLNLLPVYPLDGGQIARNVLKMFVGSVQAIPYSLMLSVGAAAFVALWSFTQGDSFIGIMFALLGYSSYQQLNMYRGPGSW